MRRERVKMMRLRATLGEVLERVSREHDIIEIERKGKTLGALLVPRERFERMEKMAREGILEYFQRRRHTRDELSDDQAMELAVNAQRWARKRLRRKKQR